MSDTSSTMFTEDGARKLIEEYLRSSAVPRNDFPRRRRHVNLGGAADPLIMFRLEEELQRGMAADARRVDKVALVTLSGGPIVVMDDINKWFGRGEPAPSGDAGGDARGNSNLGLASPTGSTDNGRSVYSVVSCGTWFRHIEGYLSDDSWVVDAGSVTGWDGEWPRSDAGNTSGDLTLAGICVEPIAGMYFQATFNEIALVYRVNAICCIPGS